MTKRKYTPASTSQKRKRQQAAIRASYARKAREVEEETYPHFRLYLASHHPALILGEVGKDKYSFRKTSHDKKGLRSSVKVVPNPNPNDDEPMYIEKKVREDKKARFAQRKFPWKYTGK